MNYFVLQDRTDACFEPAIEHFQRVYRPGACQLCSTLPDSQGPPPILKVKRIYDALPLVTFTSWMFGVMHKSLFSALSDDCKHLIYTGGLCDQDDIAIDNYITFVGKYRVIPRGGKKSQHRICSSCGAFVYSPIPGSNPYLLAQSLAQPRHVYEFGMLELMIDELTLDTVSSVLDNSVTVKEIAIRNKSKDSLPYIENWPCPEAMAFYKPNIPPWLSVK